MEFGWDGPIGCGVPLKCLLLYKQCHILFLKSLLFLEKKCMSLMTCLGIKGHINKKSENVTLGLAEKTIPGTYSVCFKYVFLYVL